MGIENLLQGILLGLERDLQLSRGNLNIENKFVGTKYFLRMIQIYHH